MDHLFVSIQPVCVFSLDHLHLIIYQYIFSYCHCVVLDLFLKVFFSFFCDLMTILSVRFGVLCVYLYYRFLVCSYLEVFVQRLYVYMIKLLISFNCILNTLHLYFPHPHNYSS